MPEKPPSLATHVTRSVARKSKLLLRPLPPPHTHSPSLFPSRPRTSCSWNWTCPHAQPMTTRVQGWLLWCKQCWTLRSTRKGRTSPLMPGMAGWQHLHVHTHHMCLCSGALHYDFTSLQTCTLYELNGGRYWQCMWLKRSVYFCQFDFFTTPIAHKPPIFSSTTRVNQPLPYQYSTCAYVPCAVSPRTALLCSTIEDVTGGLGAPKSHQRKKQRRRKPSKESSSGLQQSGQTQQAHHFPSKRGLVQTAVRFA